MRKNCLLCGVGGQGVVLASKLIAYAALDKGMFVRTTETIGMAQRGGSVVSHVRMGEEIHSPMIPKGQADVILAFEPAEAVRSLPYLREGGMLIVNRKAVKPVTATLGGGQYDGHEMLDFLKKKVDNLLIMDGEAVCRQAGSASGALDISIPDMEVEIKKKVKPQFVELNQKALALGAAIAGAQRKADGTKTEVR